MENAYISTKFSENVQEETRIPLVKN